jgi:magnesium-transporting ATPase (P-type)
VSLPGATFYLGAPERFSLGPLAAQADRRTREGRRVLAVARGEQEQNGDADERPPADLQMLGLVVLAEELRPNVRDAIEFLRGEGIEVKVLSGDAPQTVAAIARDVGIDVHGVHEGAEIPDDPAALAAFAIDATVVGRISPEGKRAVVRALAEQGRYVAMVGDGVNDVPALKSSRLAIAQGNGTQMARSVSDLVLLSGDFATVPPLLAEGRRALRNLQRVAKLYITKSAFAAFLILTIGISSEAYPLLPRHLSLAASLTIGIPTFFLALAPSSGPWRPDGFLLRVARFAVPAGALVGIGVVAGYLFALDDLDASVADARTVAVTILVILGLYLVMAIEAEGSRRRSTVVGGMCAALFGAYVAAIAIPWTRHFFALTVPDLKMVVTAVVASATSIAALTLCGYSAWSTAPSGADGDGDGDGDDDAKPASPSGR